MFAPLLGLTVENFTHNQNAKKRLRALSFPISWANHNSAKDIDFEGKHAASSAFPIIDDVFTSNCTIPQQDSIHSIEESTQVEKESNFERKHAANSALPIILDVDTPNCIMPQQDSIDSIHESAQVEKEHLTVKILDQKLKELKCLAIEKDSSYSSRSARSKKEEKKKKPIHEFFRYHVGESSLRRPIIPIGPMFQASIPKWEGPTIKRPLR